MSILLAENLMIPPPNFSPVKLLSWMLLEVQPVTKKPRRYFIEPPVFSSIRSYSLDRKERKKDKSNGGVS